jgi:hypothetical protein
MSAARPLLSGATGIVVGGVGAFAFAFPDRTEDLSPWWTLLVFVPVGVMFALVSNPRRWWVALGFAWLLSAWVEAGQAVWLPDSGRARVEDLALGCVGCTIGVLVVVAARAMAAHARALHAASGGATEVAPATAAAAAPRTR